MTRTIGIERRTDELPPGIERADRIGRSAGRNVLLESLDRALAAKQASERDLSRTEYREQAHTEARKLRDAAITSIESLLRSAELLGLSTEARARVDAAERRAVIARAEQRSQRG